MDRMTRVEAAEYIGCSYSKLGSMERAGIMKGTYYEIGNGERRRKIYITERLNDWILAGGEPAAWERKAKLDGLYPAPFMKIAR